MKQAEYQKKILRILYLLKVIVTNARLYGFAHYQVDKQVGQLLKELLALFTVIPKVTLMRIENDLIINNQPMRAEEQVNFALFVRILQEKEIGFITFNKGMKKSELRLFLKYLATVAGLGEQTESFTTPQITVGKVGLQEQKKGGTGKSRHGGKGSDGPTSDHGAHRVKGKYRDAEIAKALSVLNAIATDRLDVIKEYYDKMERHKRCDTREIEGVVSVFVKCFSCNMNPLSMLATLKESDEYTFTHSVNVCILTLAQASSLGFSKEHLLEIGVASSLHDVGKIFLPTEILNKPGKLSAEEMQVIETHPAIGASYIVSMQNLSKLAILGAMEHHIRFDGSGYPDTGGKWRTHIVSQMIAIADTFDAMRSNRSYQKSKSLEIIFKVLNKGKGSAFNPMLVDNFINIISHQPQFL